MSTNVCIEKKHSIDQDQTVERSVAFLLLGNTGVLSR